MVLTWALWAQGVSWTPTLDQALAKAAEKKQFVALQVTADWSPAGRAMQAQIESAPVFQEFSRRQMLARVDEEKDEEGRRLREKFHVSVFPTWILLSSEGREIDRITGFRSPQQLVTELQNLSADPHAFGRLLQREKDEKLSPAGALRLMQGFFERQDAAECRRRIAEITLRLAEWPAGLKAEFYFLAAQYHLQSKQFQEAAAVCDRFLAENAGAERAPQVLLFKAEALAAANRPAEAAALLDDLMDRTLGTPLGARARLLYSRLPAAQRTAKQGYRALSARAAQLASESKWPEAQSQAGQAVQAGPLNAEPHLQLARIYLLQSAQSADPIDKSQLAEKGWEELFLARRLEPDDTPSYEAEKLALPSLRGSEDGSTPVARERIAAAGRLRDEGRFHVSFDALVDALAADPGFPEVWKALQEFGEQMHLPLLRHSGLVPYELYLNPADRNVEHPRWYTRVHAQTIPAWKAYARVRQQWRQKKFHEAHPAEKIYRLTAAEEREALAAALAQWRSLKQQDERRRNDNLDFLDTVEKAQQLEAYVLLERFWEGFRPEFEAWKKEHPRAVADYMMTLFRPAAPADAPTTESKMGEAALAAATALFNQALAAHRSNDFEKASLLYEAVLAGDPSFVPARQNAAIIYFNRGNLLQAAEQAETGLQENPENSTLLYLATQSYMQLQLFDRAVLVLRRAERAGLQTQERAGVVDRLAYVYMQMQEWDRAELYLQQAAALAPGNPEIKQHIELLQEMKGKK